MFWVSSVYMPGLIDVGELALVDEGGRLAFADGELGAHLDFVVVAREAIGQDSLCAGSVHSMMSMNSPRSLSHRLHGSHNLFVFMNLRQYNISKRTVPCTLRETRCNRDITLIAFPQRRYISCPVSRPYATGLAEKDIA